mgnify:CR=1 FL=1|jgi:hypothetical protein
MAQEYVKNKDLYNNIKEYNSLLDTTDLMLQLRKKKLFESIFCSMRLIATNYLNRGNLRNYSKMWKEDMIGDASLICMEKLYKFDTKYENPFAYFTSVCVNSFKTYLKVNNRYADLNVSVDFYSNLGGVDE